MSITDALWSQVGVLPLVSDCQAMHESPWNSYNNITAWMETQPQTHANAITVGGLKPMLGNGLSKSYVKNSEHFAVKIENTTLNGCDLLVSFHVKSLLTSVPIDEAMSRVATLLLADSSLEERTTMSPATICQLTELCLRTTYFEFQEDFYKQVDGAAMASPNSSVIDNFYMEKNVWGGSLDTTADQPSLWLRYVDDTYVIWPHGPDKLKVFHSHLNCLRKSVQFTMKKEQDNHLPFLNVLVTKEGNHMATSIYSMKMHKDQYLHYESYHHLRSKSGTMSRLSSVSERLCQGDNVTKEKQHLSNVFAANGYPEEMTRKFFNKSKAKAVSYTEEEERKYTLYIPYIQELSEGVEELSKIWRSEQSLKQLSPWDAACQHQGSCVQDSMRVWKSKCGWDWKIIKTKNQWV